MVAMRLTGLQDELYADSEWTDMKVTDLSLDEEMCTGWECRYVVCMVYVCDYCMLVYLQYSFSKCMNVVTHAQFCSDPVVE